MVDTSKIKELKVIINNMMNNNELSKNDKINLLNNWYVKIDNIIMNTFLHSSELAELERIKLFINDKHNVL